MYQRINGSDWRNIWLMGDLHGCFALLMNRLRQLRFDPWADLLISVVEPALFSDVSLQARFSVGGLRLFPGGYPPGGENRPRDHARPCHRHCGRRNGGD